MIRGWLEAAAQRGRTGTRTGNAFMTEPVIAQREPYPVDLKATYRYAWCACGRSNYQPFCDGSHTMAGPDIGPIVFTAETSETVYFCGCKHSGNKPYCDGSHRTLD